MNWKWPAIACTLSFLAGAVAFACFLTLSPPIVLCEVRMKAKVWGITHYQGKKQYPIHGWVTVSKLYSGTFIEENRRPICLVDPTTEANQSSPVSRG